MHKEWLKCWRATIFVTGDVEEQSAREVQATLDTLVQQAMPVSQIGEVRPVQLEEHTLPIYQWQHENSEEKNSCYYKVFQLPQGDSLQESLMTSLLVTALRTNAFEQLRTTEQLGYIVFTFEGEVRGVSHFQVLIQSDVKSPHYLASRV